MDMVRSSVARPSPQAIICAGMILAGVGTGLFYRDWSRPPVPYLHPQDDAIELGDVWVQQAIHRSIALHNLGHAPLEVEITKVSCGCTEAQLSTSTIGSMGSGSLDIELKAPDREGPFQVNVGLETNDPITPHKVFRIGGKARKRVDIQPISLQFGNVNDKQLPLDQTFEVKNILSDTTNVLDSIEFKCSVPYIVIDKILRDDTLAVKVSLTKDAPIGTMREDLLVRFHNDDGYSLKVPIMARVFGRYSPEPETFYFSHVRPNSSVSGSVLIPNVVSSDVVTASVRNLELQECTTVNTTHSMAGCKVELILTLPGTPKTLRSVVDMTIQSPDGQRIESIQVPLVISLMKSSDGEVATQNPAGMPSALRGQNQQLLKYYVK